MLILSAQADGGEDRQAGAFGVFYCNFDQQWDEDFDRWPDRWVRQSSPEYPHYVNIAIQDDKTAAGNKCLRIDLDGAAAAVSSPPIRVVSRFSYAFEAQLKCEQLKYSTCILSLQFCDSAGRVLHAVSESRTLTKGWERIAIGPLEPGDPHIDYVTVVLQVVRGSQGDLQGRVSLADVWLCRLPRITVSTNNPCNVFTGLDDVRIQCELSGIRERDPEIRFRLYDAGHNVRDSHSRRLNGQLIVDDKRQRAEVNEGTSEDTDSYEGRITWRPKIPDYGYYDVDIEMLGTTSTDPAGSPKRKLDTRRVSLAVVPPLSMPRQGDFGWTLTDNDPLPFQELSRLLPLVGINWVKLPVWFDAGDPGRSDALIRFVELLSASNIETVGVIEPSRAPGPASSPKRAVPAADLLLDSSASWLASLEPVMTRLSLRVRWWQLGRDKDTSFAGVNGLVKRIDELRSLLFRFGQDVKLGMNWEWEANNQSPGNVSWEFEQMCQEPDPSGKKFAELLSAPRKNSAEHWVLIEPPSRLADELQDDHVAQMARVNEFVHRLIVAKVHGADRVFVPHPFSDENGLMHSNGMPGELLLPWRTTAAMLSGARYLGEMQLPGDSRNRIFQRPDGQVVMVVWNSAATRERLYLGSDVRYIDLDGHSSTPPVEDHEQIIDVGPQPAFVLGLHEAITRWRLAATFADQHVPSIYSKPHRNSLKVKNFFPLGVGGSLAVIVPQADRDRWTIEPSRRSFSLAADEETQFPFDIRLKNAYYGEQPIRVDFKLQADEEYQFSTYTKMDVGSDDLTLDVKTHLDNEGTLIVEQFMTNKADRLADFRCYLLSMAFDQTNIEQRRQRMQVYRLGPKTDRKVYRIPNGKSLVGRQLTLVIEEVNGLRVINYRFVATADVAEENSSGDRPSQQPPDEDPQNSDAASHMAVRS